MAVELNAGLLVAGVVEISGISNLILGYWGGRDNPIEYWATKFEIAGKCYRCGLYDYVSCRAYDGTAPNESYTHNLCAHCQYPITCRANYLIHEKTSYHPYCHIKTPTSAERAIKELADGKEEISIASDEWIYAPH